MSLYVMHAALAAVAFLGVLGMLLSGVRRVQVGVLVAVVWVGLLWAVWSDRGRLAGLTAAGMSLLYAAVSLPLAGPAARSLFGVEPGETASGPPPPSALLQRISEALAAEGPGGPATDALLDLCLANPAVQVVLVRHHASGETLRECLASLLRMGAGRWIGDHYLAASTIAYPRTLEALLAAGPGAREATLARIAAHLEYGAPL